MGSASSLHQWTTVAICSSQTPGAASGLPEGCFLQSLERTSWSCLEEVCWTSQPPTRVGGSSFTISQSTCRRRLGRAPQPRVFSLLRHRCSQNAAAALLLPLQMFGPGCREPGWAKPGFHLIIMPTSGEGGARRGEWQRPHRAIAQ